MFYKYICNGEKGQWLLWIKVYSVHCYLQVFFIFCSNCTRYFNAHIFSLIVPKIQCIFLIEVIPYNSGFLNLDTVYFITLITHFYRLPLFLCKLIYFPRRRYLYVFHSISALKTQRGSRGNALFLL